MIGSYMADKGAFFLENAETYISNKEDVYILVANGRGVGIGTPENTVFSLQLGVQDDLLAKLKQMKYVKFTLSGSLMFQATSDGHTYSSNKITFGNRDDWGTVLASIEWTGSQFRAKAPATCVANGTPCDVDIQGQVDTAKQVLTSATGRFKAFSDAAFNLVDTRTMDVQNLSQCGGSWGIGFCATGAAAKSNVSNISLVSVYPNGKRFKQYVSTDWTAPSTSIWVEFLNQ